MVPRLLEVKYYIIRREKTCGRDRRGRARRRCVGQPSQSKFWKEVFPICIVAAIVMAIVVYVDDPLRSTTTAPPKTSTPTRIVTATEQELFDDYQDNEVATDRQLKGAIIEITGVVEAINKNVWGTIYVNLKTSNQFMPAAMHVAAQEETKVAALRRGQSVVFRCPKMQRWAGSPSGDDCILMSVDY
jgi:hypothetical protein